MSPFKKKPIHSLRLLGHLLLMSFRSSPPQTTGMPSGIPYIISNEAAERFSFYGMKAALAVFLVNYLSALGGENLTESEATSYTSYFNSAVYFTPLLGAFLADGFAGKYRTILVLSVVYCLGHLCLAFTGIGGVVQFWLLSGLGLIALGAGGIKSCVSAHVGDQFGAANAHLLPKVFNLFYFSINAGAILSNLSIPLILYHFGPHWAFGIPGILMALATLFFWMGRQKFIHIPADRHEFLAEFFSWQGFSVLLRLSPLYLFVAIFWCLFDQTANTFVFQAEKMDRFFFGYEVLPSQIQAVNPFLILILIPLFTYVIYPSIERIVPLTPLRKIGAGLFLMVLSFQVVTWSQERIDAGATPHVLWQILAYSILTSAEIMVSIVCLEFSYTQATPRMKSMVMGFFLASVALGNGITGLVNDFIRVPVSPLDSPPISLQSAAKDASRILTETGQLPPHLGNIGKIRYELLHAGQARLSLPGPDQEFRTADDETALLTLIDERKEDPDSWLARELAKKEVAGGSADSLLSIPLSEQAPFTLQYQRGGGTRLEGSAYFATFTKLMLIAALLFIPYAYFYRGKTYLQG